MTEDQERALWELIEKFPVMYQFEAGRFVLVQPIAMFRYLARAVEVAEEAARRVAGDE